MYKRAWTPWALRLVVALNYSRTLVLLDSGIPSFRVMQSNLGTRTISLFNINKVTSGNPNRFDMAYRIQIHQVLLYINKTACVSICLASTVVNF